MEINFGGLVRLVVVGCFRDGGAGGLSSSESEPQVSSSAQCALACVAVTVEDCDEAR